MIVNPIGRRVYPYMPSWKVMISLFLFFTFASIVVGVKAAGNTGGVRLFRLIEWSQKGATRFYITISILCGVFALVGLFGLWKRFARPQEIVVDDEGLEVPRSILSRDRVRVPFAEIASVSITEVMGERTMRVDSRDGSKREIAQNHLPSKKSLDEILEILRARTGLVPPPGAP